MSNLTQRNRFGASFVKHGSPIIFHRSDEGTKQEVQRFLTRAQGVLSGSNVIHGGPTNRTIVIGRKIENIQQSVEVLIGKEGKNQGVWDSFVSKMKLQNAMSELRNEVLELLEVQNSLPPRKLPQGMIPSGERV